MKSAYYNENDAYACQWLRNLITAGLIPAGDVDERSIVDVRADDLAGYEQCHFFAGIGGWSYALRLAGWPDDRLAWTGSCPCQPISSAGKQKGHADERHLWPAFYELIAECRPATVFGEQVAGALGRKWLAGVRADLEAAGYAVGTADLCAAGVSAPHIRQRLFWVANAEYEQHPRRAGEEARGEPANGSGMGDALGPRLEERPGSRRNDEPERPAAERAGGHAFWSRAEWLQCLDGKARRAQPGIFPLAAGLPAAMDGDGPISRVGTLSGAGNAIVAQAAAEFVRAFLECAP